jgi:cell division ATPase FtsA
LPLAAIYFEVFDYRVSSTGAKRFEQCTLTETSRVLSADELAAWHYVTFRGVNSDELLRKLNLSEAQAQEVSKRAEKKMQDYEKNERNISNYCTSLLVAEDNYGELKTRFMRTSAQRAGTPVGLKGIDTASNRPKPSNAFGAEVASIKAEIEDINAQNTKQPSAESLHNEIKNTPEYQEVKSLQNTQAANATTSLLSKGCKGAGRSDAFCSCFVESFITDIGESGGSAALPVIQDGLSNNDVMALMKSIDQSRYMQDMTKAQSISEKCESLEN